MHIRLTEGTWAMSHGADVHIGLLRGAIDRGWQASFATLPGRVLPAVVRRLNLDGIWTDGTVDVSVASGMARLVVEGRTVLLDPRATARLQVFCTHVRHELVRRQPDPGPPVRVATERAGLRVIDLTRAGEQVGATTMRPAAHGAVEMAVPTTTGPLRLSLPALPLLVAAAEADADRDTLVLRVPRVDAEALWLPLPAHEARQAAAEAQWLLPAFARRIGQHHT